MVPLILAEMRYIIFKLVHAVSRLLLTTKACFMHYQCVPVYIVCKLSAYSADVCKLASLGSVCGYKPLIHTTETKPTFIPG